MTECARKYTRDIARAVNMTAYADKGILPAQGGLLDQSAWFIDLWSAVMSDQAMVERERMERRQ